MPNKRQNTYIKVLQIILDEMDAIVGEIKRPENFIIDFEKAEENAIRHCIPEVNIHGCFFHFSQAVFRQIQTLNLQQRYGNDFEFNTMIKKFVALAFCRVNDVYDRYNVLADELLTNFGDTDENQNFIQYFENTWVGRARRNPLFSIEMWNCLNMTEIHLPRTNNSVESFHKSFQTAFACHHPTIFKLLEALLNEQVRVNSIYVRLEANEILPLYTRKEYQNANQRLLAIIENYENVSADDYLKACSNYVAI